MKPNQIKHLTDSELMLCRLVSEEHVREWKKEYEKRGRLPGFQAFTGIDRGYVAEHWV